MKPLLLRKHHFECLSFLTDAQLGRVIRNLLNAANNEYYQEADEQIIRIATMFMITDINRLHNQRNSNRGMTCAEWAELRGKVFLRDKCTCQYCGRTGIDMTCDHVEPRQHGGDDGIENLVTACRSCNSKKGALSYLGGAF